MNSAHLRRFIVLLILLAFAAQLQAASPSWLEVRSKHFSVITDDGENKGREVALRFEQMRSAFSTMFLNASLNETATLPIVAFRNSKEIQQIGPMFNGKPVEMAGFFGGDEGGNFIALDLSSPNGYRTVFHEYAHFLINSNLRFLPLWLNEGYAEFLSTLYVSGNSIHLGTFPPGFKRLLLSTTWLKNSELLSISTRSREYNEGNRRGIFYAQSWLAVHYIIMNGKAAQLDTYLNLSGRQRVPIPDAFREAFTVTPEQFEGELRVYLNSQMRYLHATAPQEDGGPYLVQPLKEVDSAAILADAKMHSGHHVKEGIEELEHILQIDPKNFIANRGLAAWYLRFGNFEGAAPYVHKAAESGSKDPAVHFYTAMLLSRSSWRSLSMDKDRLAEVQSELQKAIELDPTFAPAYNLLAFSYSFSGDNRRALELQRKAVDLNPRNGYYMLNLAKYADLAQQREQAAEIYRELIVEGDATIVPKAQRALEDLQTDKDGSQKSAPKPDPEKN